MSDKTRLFHKLEASKGKRAQEATQHTNSKDLDEISGLRRFEREDRTNGSSPKRKSSLPEISLNTEFANKEKQ